MKIKHARNHADLRAAEYMPIGDQLDIIIKGMAKRMDLLSEEEKALVDHVKSVKAKYPKP